MNDEQREALVHLLQTVMEISYKMGQQRSHYDVADEAKRLADVIEDDFLTDRADHPDDIAVDKFAEHMKAKLGKKRSEGRSGWENPDVCSTAYLSEILREHVSKGDPLDVANIAMMLHMRGERIDDHTTTAAEPDSDVIERVGWALFRHWFASSGAPLQEVEEAWDYHLAFTEKFNFEPIPRTLEQARAAIAAMPSCADADSWLDDALDSVHPDAYIGNNFYRPDRQDYAVIVHWPLPDGVWSWRGFSEYRSDGHGPTRKVAILDACAKAKEASK